MSAAAQAFQSAFDALPEGSFQGLAHGKRYVVSKTRASNDGRAWKLVAEELGGADYISLNLYRLSTGDRLFPCEMPLLKVERFVLDLTPG